MSSKAMIYLSEPLCPKLEDTPFCRAYPSLIEVFGYQKIYKLRDKLSTACLTLMEYVLEHEFKFKKIREINLQEFADELFGSWDVSQSDNGTSSIG